MGQDADRISELKTRITNIQNLSTVDRQVDGDRAHAVKNWADDIRFRHGST